MKKIDLTGQKFGYLTVLYEAPKRNNRIMWHCKCICGKELDVLGESLRSGHTKSCGCKKAEGNHKLNLIGKKYNHLTVLAPTEKRIAHCIVWKCQCDCGNITYVSTNDLRTGNTKSCGCLKSKGEEKISLLLKENNINYEHQYLIEFNNKKYYYDFFIKNNNNQYFIEYDGIQHFQTKTGGWNNLENLKQTQERDKIKNKYCYINNIPLIRIPYTHYENITIKDLLLESSQFLYKEE